MKAVAGCCREARLPDGALQEDEDGVDIEAAKAETLRKQGRVEFPTTVALHFRRQAIISDYIRWRLVDRRPEFLWGSKPEHLLTLALAR